MLLKETISSSFLFWALKVSARHPKDDAVEAVPFVPYDTRLRITSSLLMAFVAVQLIKVLLLMSLTNLDSALKSPVPTGRISPQRCATGDDSTDAN